MTEARIQEPSRPVLSRSSVWLPRAYVILVLPVLLLLTSVRLVMTPLFLQLEYNRPDFPEDFYGFTPEDRLTYAPYALQYLLNAEDIDFLGNLRFTNGKSLFNARELRHMRDVKVITQYAYLFAVVNAIVALAISIYLYRKKPTALYTALSSGAILTLGIIAAVVVIAVINWDFFFTGFHTLFFDSGTWRFEYSDTLIRLFPEQFWFDAALTIGAITSLEAIAMLILIWWHRRHSAERQHN